VISVRIDNLSRDIGLIIDESLSPKVQAELFAEEARAIIREIDDANDRSAGRDVEFETFVDGSPDETLSGVKISSRIVATWEFGSTVLADILDMLKASAPVKTGRYRNTLVLLADGVEADPANPPQAGEYVFVSPQPYARKIEAGKGKYGPAGRMEGVAAVAQRRFGNFARVRFTYRSINASGRRDKADRQPALVVTLR